MAMIEFEDRSEKNQRDLLVVFGSRRADLRSLDMPALRCRQSVPWSPERSSIHLPELRGSLTRQLSMSFGGINSPFSSLGRSGTLGGGKGAIPHGTSGE
jgi:hypothetical protein